MPVLQHFNSRCDRLAMKAGRVEVKASAHQSGAALLQGFFGRFWQQQGQHRNAFVEQLQGFVS